jgi:putative acetyltransferase
LDIWPERAYNSSMGSLMLDIQMRPFQPGDERAFYDINEAWITKYFTMEDADRATLENPQTKILAPGGHIFFAVADETPVGCCALIAMKPREYEVAKMGVLESYRNQGIGRQVLEYTVRQAQELGARRLYLETNSKLASAIHLYESLGFRHVPPSPSPYARANVFMEMVLP